MGLDDAGKVVALVSAVVVTAGGIGTLARRAFPTTARDLRSDIRRYQDYAHECRALLSENGVTPPDWPEGLNQ